MKDRLTRTFFVKGNCDILRIDYLAALEFHQQNSYAFTIIGALKKMFPTVSFISRGATSTSGREARCSADRQYRGLYFEQSCIDLIESGEKVDMPDLIA
ncbi:hypothetical protein MASR1M66_11580 [Aminivibrio sp.]